MAGGQGVAQSGVQHPIFSWSAALPVSAPGIVQLTDGAARARPGLPTRDSAITMARISFSTDYLIVARITPSSHRGSVAAWQALPTWMDGATDYVNHNLKSGPQVLTENTS